MLFLSVLTAVLAAFCAGCLLILLGRRREPQQAFDPVALTSRLETLDRAFERIERALRTDLASARTEAGNSASRLREELQRSIAALGKAQSSQLGQIIATTDQKLEAVRGVVDTRLLALQEDNALKLEQMRRTVDEQLQGTLEKRLNQSFQLVSDRLEQVYKGLGEMQNLASGVGDLKKVLSDVRARGAWGEIQLGALLEQMLCPDQYARNVATTNTAERVEFALRLPGPDEHSTVWLPIDSKFPQEDYLRVVEASERGDRVLLESSLKQLEIRIKSCAKEIRNKYLAPPNTTDFAIMYLPTESLFAEVLRRSGLVEMLQRDYRVTVTGPTTMAALLNSLQMGFRTLAIQQRSSQVWELLAAVKTEFGKYADVLEAVHRKLEQANKTVEDGLTRTRVINRKLKDVTEMPADQAAALLPDVPFPMDEVFSDR